MGPIPASGVQIPSGLLMALTSVSTVPSGDGSYVITTQSDTTGTVLPLNISDSSTSLTLEYRRIETALYNSVRIPVSVVTSASSTARQTYYVTSNLHASTLAFMENAWCQSYYWKPTKEQLFRDRIRRQLAPTILGRQRDIWHTKVNPAEIRARHLLRELIGDQEYKDYLRKGFVMVEGRSGIRYKISGGYSMVVSYKKDEQGHFQPHEKFCVQFKDSDLPFTDGTIMRLIMVHNDEFELRRASNVFQITPIRAAA